MMTSDRGWPTSFSSVLPVSMSGSPGSAPCAAIPEGGGSIGCQEADGDTILGFFLYARAQGKIPELLPPADT